MTKLSVDVVAVLLPAVIAFCFGCYITNSIVTADIKADCKTMRMFRLGATVYDCTEQPKEK